MQENRQTNRRQSRKRPRNEGRKQGQRQRSPKDSERYTVIDHAPSASLIAGAIPVLCKSLGITDKSIINHIAKEAGRFTDKHRVSYEGHSDIIDELQEREDDFKSEKAKLKTQLPEKLVEEGKIQPIYLAGLIGSGTMFALSFGATVVVTSTQVQEYSSNGSWYYAVSTGLIAGFGSSLLKWATLYPFADYKKHLEMLFVPVGLGFFSLFVYQLTDLYFYTEPVATEVPSAPDFSSYLGAEEPVAPSPATEGNTPSLISLKWLYIGVIGTEVFSSYAFLSFIATCATWQLKPIVRAIKELEARILAPRHTNRVTIRKSRKQSAWLQFQAKMAQAPGRAIKAVLDKLLK